MNSNESSTEFREFQSDQDSVGVRLDVFLAEKVSDFSRVQIRRAISKGNVTVDGALAKPSYRLKADQLIRYVLDPEVRAGPEPENIPLDILYEDEFLVAVSKPPAMVVHPSKGHWQGTLASALSYHFQNLSSVGGATRPGIVHRLDRDTSGVILIAKSNDVHLALAEQFESRSIEKEYLAICSPPPDRDRDRIEKSIGMHPHQREKMAIREDHTSSRSALTFYEVANRFGRFAIVRVFPKTGRTHQIRVHFAHIGSPVICDNLYSSRREIRENELIETGEDRIVLARQALHAKRIKFQHPVTKKELEIVAPVRDDLQRVIDLLSAAYSKGA